MPGMNGLTVLNPLCTTEGRTTVPIRISTALPGMVDDTARYSSLSSQCSITPGVNTSGRINGLAAGSRVYKR